ncbi:hypothetical protein FOZ62_030716, partial [Perkinsus olseni]
RLQKRSLLVTADDVVSVLGNSATTTQYADSKRAILSYVASKSGSPSRDPSTKFVACTPGFCNTNLGAPFLPGVLYSALAPFRWLLLRDSTEGALGVLKALLDTRVENGDFVDSAEVLEHLPRTRPDLFVGEAVKNWAISAHGQVLESPTSGPHVNHYSPASSSIVAVFVPARRISYIVKLLEVLSDKICPGKCDVTDGRADYDPSG